VPIRDILSLPINSERLGKLTENFVVSNHKIKRELARSLHYIWRGLLKTFESFRK
jgi:hypothetical protein